LIAASAVGFPFFAAISVMLKKIEGDIAPCSYILIAVATYIQVTILIMGILFTMIVYRPDMPAVLVQILSDFAFFLFVGPAIPIAMQYMAIGVAVLGDKRQTPILPRWFGYLNLWVAGVSTTSCVIGFFKTGPLAWNGVIAFWLPVAALGIWLPATIWMMFAAIARNALTTD